MASTRRTTTQRCVSAAAVDVDLYAADTHSKFGGFNAVWPGEAIWQIWHQASWSVLVHGTKPLLEAMLISVRLPGTYFDAISFNTWIFSFKNIYLKVFAAKWRPLYVQASMCEQCWGVNTCFVLSFSAVRCPCVRLPSARWSDYDHFPPSGQNCLLMSRSLSSKNCVCSHLLFIYCCRINQIWTPPKILNSQKVPDSLPSRTSFELSIVRSVSRIMYCVIKGKMYFAWECSPNCHIKRKHIGSSLD